MDKDKNMYLIKRYCKKESEALNVLEEAGVIYSMKVYRNIVRLARDRNRDYTLRDDVYKQNYYNAARIRRNFPQFRGIVKYIYKRYKRIPTRFVRLRINENGKRYIGIDTFLNLFK